MKKVTVEDIIEIIEQTSKPAIVLVDGIGGSGKSTFSKQIANTFENSLCINLDAYTVEEGGLYSEKSFKNNFNLAYEEIPYKKDEILNEVNIDKYDFVILEGCFSFKFIDFLEITYKIWISVDRHIAMSRMAKRELNDRSALSKDIILESLKAWQECEKRYIDKFDPVGHADFVL